MTLDTLLGSAMSVSAMDLVHEMFADSDSIQRLDLAGTQCMHANDNVTVTASSKLIGESE